MGRPWASLPPGARDCLLAMASTTGLKESVAAAALGVPLKDFRRIIAKDERSKMIWDEALATERDVLLGAMFAKAKEGDQKAAAFLLASRHGMSERTPESTGAGRVNITFQLPAALPPEQYAKLVTESQATPLPSP